MKIPSISLPFEYTSALGIAGARTGRPWSVSAPPSDSVGWKDPSVSPNEVTEMAWDLDCSQEFQSRAQREKAGMVQTRLFFPACLSSMLDACNYLEVSCDSFMAE